MNHKRYDHGYQVDPKKKSTLIPDKTTLAININYAYERNGVVLINAGVRPDVTANKPYRGSRITLLVPHDKLDLLMWAANLNPNNYVDYAAKINALPDRNVTVFVGTKQKKSNIMLDVKPTKTGYIVVDPQVDANSVIIKVYRPQQLASDEPIHSLELINVDTPIVKMMEYFRYSGLDRWDLFPRPAKWSGLLNNKIFDYSQLTTAQRQCVLDNLNDRTGYEIKATIK